MLKAYKYRLYPKKQQANKLQEVLEWCRELYNAALQERRGAYEIPVKRHPNFYDEETRKQLVRTPGTSGHSPEGSGKRACRTG